MTAEILTAAGVLHRKSRFIRLPEETHAVYFDDISADGADSVGLSSGGIIPQVLTHDIRIELYETKQDDAAEAAIEAELTSRGLLWTKQDRYWLDDVQRYQVIYEYSYTSKTQ